MSRAIRHGLSRRISFDEMKHRIRFLRAWFAFWDKHRNSLLTLGVRVIIIRRRFLDWLLIIIRRLWLVVIIDCLRLLSNIFLHVVIVE